MWIDHSRDCIKHTIDTLEKYMNQISPISRCFLDQSECVYILGKIHCIGRDALPKDSPVKGPCMRNKRQCQHREEGKGGVYGLLGPWYRASTRMRMEVRGSPQSV
ncbi:hypothetical protein CISG_09845 [Coccidioides immitis RMSCC 3703]|uniref:Uncharacterized protein n=1 Tax=Coccidioides immitis RMSCC 3703 TaxID=454286 RepID=A0A0J8QKC5_COCIT|nr:hypothetical protein CISG_09845 [Coccidioides immitis RMSCC 3703]